jgi:phosphohistidine phosphatase
MKLLIVRHAIAAERVEGAAGVSDEKRPLTDKGVRRMREAASGLQRLVERPDAIYTSPLVRAVDTARIVAEAWGRVGPKPEKTDLLAPGHPAAEVVRWLRTLSQDRTVAVVGHEPNCSELLSLLLAGGPGLTVDFRKGGAALIDLPAHGAHARGVLLWFAPPRILRLAG